MATAEAKKEEFQKYLEKSGVIDSLTKVLVGLYETQEKPPNAIDFIKEYLGAPVAISSGGVNGANGAGDEALKKRIAELEKMLEERDKEIANLKKNLESSNPAPAGASGSAGDS